MSIGRRLRAEGYVSTQERQPPDRKIRRIFDDTRAIRTEVLSIRDYKIRWACLGLFIGIPGTSECVAAERTMKDNRIDLPQRG
jgi:hypothetical protein